MNKATRHLTSKKAIPQFEIAVPGSPKEVSERRFKTSESPNEQVGDNVDYAKIYIANLRFDTQSQELEDVFGQFGVVSDVKMPKDVGTTDNRGYAFVEFETVSAAKVAVAKSGQIRVGGRPIRIELANPVSLRRTSPVPEASAGAVRVADPRKIFVANLPAKLKEEALLEVLLRYGNVLELHVKDPNTGEQRNYAFVTFAKPEFAKLALEQSGKIVLGGRVLYFQEYSQKTESRT